MRRKINSIITKSKKKTFSGAIQDKSTQYIWKNIKAFTKNTNKTLIQPTKLQKRTSDMTSILRN